MQTARILAAACALCVLGDGPAALGDLPSSPRSREVWARVAPPVRAELTAVGLSLGSPVFLRLFKEERTLEVWVRNPGTGLYELFERQDICAWSGALGPKLREGDGQAPEGYYALGPGSLNPRSDFHLSMNLGYPNAFDRAHGRTGSFLMIHGACVSAGCYAMTDARIERLWVIVTAAMRRGQRQVPVHVFPFRMTEARMRRAEGSPHHRFWEQLRAGHDAFVATWIPPRVVVRDGRYVVRPTRER